MAKKSYSDLLKDPRWQKKRLEVLSRDEFTCKLCGDKQSTLHVHHFKYSGNPWEVDSNHLTTLCWVCHYEIETVQKYVKKNEPDFVLTFEIYNERFMHKKTCGKDGTILISINKESGRQKASFYNESDQSFYAELYLNDIKYTNLNG